MRSLVWACLAAPALAFLAPTPLTHRASTPAAALTASSRRTAPSVFEQQACSSTALYAASGFPFDFFGQAAPAQTTSEVKSTTRKIVVVTGTSSGLGAACAKSLAARGDYYIICAVRDVDKMRAMAPELGLDSRNSAILELDLARFDSVRKFAKDLKAFKSGKPLDALVCNAAVYLPARDFPTYTPDGIEESLQINHLSHFLLVSLLIDDLRKAADPRCVIVGSITGNTNTIGGAFVFPRANLGNLQGMAKGAKKPISMIDGRNFNGAKAYKDSKVCNMMTVNELHRRYHEATGISFNSMYPGCIAETNLFREKRQWFRTLFPLFMKYVTGGYVSESEAGERLAQCVYDDVTRESGQYWSWNGNAQQVGFFDPATGQVKGAGGSGGEIFPNTLSDECLNVKKSERMWELSNEITGAKWPKLTIKN